MKKLLFTILIFLTSAILSSCSSESKPITETFFAMDTYISITVYNKNDAKYLEEAFKLCLEYEELLSKTSNVGDVKKIESNRFNDTKVSEETLEIISIYKSLYGISEEKLDCTIGSVTSLWDFKNNYIPDATLIAEAVKYIDLNSLSISSDSVSLNSYGAYLDFGAVAKGYVSEKVKDFLIKKGIKHAILNFGGNVVTIGTKPDGSDYIIGIQKPFNKQNETITAVSVSNKSVITAGIYERYVEKNNNIFHHILDPETGYGAETNLNSATIICDDAALGDAYSTICILLGQEKALNLINNTDNIEAILVNKNNDVILSDNASEYLYEE